MILSGPFFLPYRFFCTSWNPLALGVRVNVESCWYKQGLQKTFSFAVFRSFLFFCRFFRFFWFPPPSFSVFFNFLCAAWWSLGVVHKQIRFHYSWTPPLRFFCFLRFVVVSSAFQCCSQESLLFLSTRVCQVVALSSLVVNVAVEVGQLLCPVFSLRSLCVWRAINV